MKRQRSRSFQPERHMFLTMYGRNCESWLQYSFAFLPKCWALPTVMWTKPLGLCPPFRTDPRPFSSWNDSDIRVFPSCFLPSSVNSSLSHFKVSPSLVFFLPLLHFHFSDYCHEQKGTCRISTTPPVTQECKESIVITESLWVKRETNDIWVAHCERSVRTIQLNGWFLRSSKQ